MKARILIAALACLTAQDVLDAECRTQCFASGKDGGVALSDKTCRCFVEVEKLDQQNRPIMWNVKRAPAPKKSSGPVYIYNAPVTNPKKTTKEKDFDDDDVRY